LGEKVKIFAFFPSKYKRIGFKSGTKTGCFRKHQIYPKSINLILLIISLLGLSLFQLNSFAVLLNSSGSLINKNNQQFGVRSLWVVADISFLYFKHIDSLL